VWTRTGHTAFRLNLHPLQVGHLYLLHELDLSIDVPRDIDSRDAMVTTFVCAQPWQESRRLVRSLSGRIFFRCWKLFLKRINPIHEQAKLRQYFNDALTIPNLLSTGDEKALEGPLHYRLTALLTETFGFSYELAMDLSAKDAMHLWAAEAERKGVAEFAGRKMNALFEIARERDRELVARGELDPVTGQRLKQN
jgi:hypothetical protein